MLVLWIRDVGCIECRMSLGIPVRVPNPVLEESFTSKKFTSRIYSFREWHYLLQSMISLVHDPSVWESDSDRLTAIRFITKIIYFPPPAKFVHWLALSHFKTSYFLPWTGLNLEQLTRTAPLLPASSTVLVLRIERGNSVWVNHGRKR